MKASLELRLRALYMSLTVIYCVIISLKVLHFYLHLPQLSNKVKKTGSCVTLSMLVCFISSNIIHSMHIFDHMYRPVYYHEPVLAYQKYLVTEVEVGNYTTLVTSWVGLLGIQGMLAGVHSKNGGLIRSNVLSLVFYIIFGCVINFVHYLFETPANYGTMANFTISGSGIICIPFAILIVYAWVTIPVKAGLGKSVGKGESGVPLLEDEQRGPGRVTRSGARNSGQAETARHRSKTPVKK